MKRIHIIGRKNSGKTTLIVELVTELTRQGYRVGTSLLKNKLAELKQKFSAGEVQMPTAWGGYRVKTVRVEFWQGGKNRLHDRIEYRWLPEKETWNSQRLAP